MYGHFGTFQIERNKRLNLQMKKVKRQNQLINMPKLSMKFRYVFFFSFVFAYTTSVYFCTNPNQCTLNFVNTATITSAKKGIHIGFCTIPVLDLVRVFFCIFKFAFIINSSSLDKQVQV